MKILSTVPLDERGREQVREAGGAGIELVSSRDAGELLAAARDTEVIYGGITPPLIAAAERLRWVHISSAGVDRFLFPEMMAHPAVVTNSQGVAAVSIAEHAFALILAFTRGLPEAFRHQQQSRWAYAQLTEIRGQTLGIIGLGHVGREVAQRAAGFGLRILAVDLRSVERPAHVAALWSPERLPELFAASDIVVNCTPLTPLTRRMIGADLFARMKPTALFVNVSRGPIVDQEALIAALREGQLAGALLDVVEPEPLPADSPLWKMPNVILTAHTATTSQHFRQRLLDLFCDNLRRYRAGEPLRNVVDKAAGF